METGHFSVSFRAHPRSRGEHFIFTVACERSSGSSPLARGTPEDSNHPRRHLGLIPARAGNTQLVQRIYGIHWAHPRSRGEHNKKPTRCGWVWGSSPLARGTHCLDRHCQQPEGLIPARAGNTRRLGRRAQTERAHPRSRGEHAKKFIFGAIFAGSSPLARGTLGITDNLHKESGLIPARAGNTPPPRYASPPPRAHPRSRGEHATSVSGQSMYSGSSPLARGTLHPGRAEADRPGLIPARAGNTIIASEAAVPFGAHPRSRGEHLTLAAAVFSVAGSSPLARGTRAIR